MTDTPVRKSGRPHRIPTDLVVRYNPNNPVSPTNEHTNTQLAELFKLTGTQISKMRAGQTIGADVIARVLTASQQPFEKMFRIEALDVRYTADGIRLVRSSDPGAAAPASVSAPVSASVLVTEAALPTTYAEAVMAGLPQVAVFPRAADGKLLLTPEERSTGGVELDEEGWPYLWFLPDGRIVVAPKADLEMVIDNEQVRDLLLTLGMNLTSLPDAHTVLEPEGVVL